MADRRTEYDRLIDAAPDMRDALEIICYCSSQEWQEADGSIKSATDNRGRKFWFITEDVMREARAAFTKATGEQQ